MNWLSMCCDSDQVDYYQSMANLEGLWEGIERIFDEMYQKTCRIVYMLEKHMQSRMGRCTVSKDYAEREKELLECIAPKRQYVNQNDEAAALKKKEKYI